MTTLAVPAREAGHFMQERRADLTFLSALFKRWRTRSQARRTLARVSRLPPHLICDMGFDPETVYLTLKGSRDEVGPYR